MPERRANHEGTIRQKPDGRWEGSISIDGQRHWVTGRSQAEVRNKLAEVRRQHHLGRLVAPTRLTLAEWVSQWLDQAEPNLRPSTMRTYRQTLSHVLAHISHQRLDKLTPALLVATFTVLQRKSIGARRLQLAHGYLKTCLKRAVDLEILGTNPMNKVPKPKWEARERQYWTIEETARFVRTRLASPTKWAPLFAVLATCGLRISEALGLTWGDVDLKARTLRVERALVWASSEHVLVPPKTRAGRRMVSLPEPAILALQKLPRPLDEQQPIFRTSTGRPPRPDHLRKPLNALCKEAGVPRLNVHGLRHVAATLALKVTGDAHTVQKRLGHAHVNVTVGIYGYAMQGDTEVAEALERALGGNETKTL